MAAEEGPPAGDVLAEEALADVLQLCLASWALDIFVQHLFRALARVQR